MKKAKAKTPKAAAKKRGPKKGSKRHYKKSTPVKGGKTAVEDFTEGMETRLPLIPEEQRETHKKNLNEVRKGVTNLFKRAQATEQLRLEAYDLLNKSGYKLKNKSLYQILNDGQIFELHRAETVRGGFCFVSIILSPSFGEYHVFTELK